jgi:hypothetical protein
MAVCGPAPAGVDIDAGNGRSPHQESGARDLHERRCRVSARSVACSLSTSRSRPGPVASADGVGTNPRLRSRQAFMTRSVRTWLITA